MCGFSGFCVCVSVRLSVKVVRAQAVADCMECIQSEWLLMTLESKLFIFPSVGVCV